MNEDLAVPAREIPREASPTVPQTGHRCHGWEHAATANREPEHSGLGLRVSIWRLTHDDLSYRCCA